jgi:hypothetical protein
MYDEKRPDIFGQIFGDSDHSASYKLMDYGDIYLGKKSFSDEQSQ